MGSASKEAFPVFVYCHASIQGSPSVPSKDDGERNDGRMLLSYIRVRV